jgi:hypothetical protein
MGNTPCSRSFTVRKIRTERIGSPTAAACGTGRDLSGRDSRIRDRGRQWRQRSPLPGEWEFESTGSSRTSPFPRWNDANRRRERWRSRSGPPGSTSDLALAGGVNVILLPELSINFSKGTNALPRWPVQDLRCVGQRLCPGGKADGVIVLKRLSDATAAGDRILALVRGSAVNQDGPSGGLTVPSGPAQEAVIHQALSNSGVTAGDVGYIEAHGTGTSLGNPIEVGALGKVFGERPAADPLVIGSVKTNREKNDVALRVKMMAKTNHRLGGPPSYLL